MQKDNEDILLIQRFLDGSEEAFNGLVRKYQKRIYFLALRILGNHHDAEEIAQETFIRVYRSLKELKEQEYFFTWLYRITLNLCFTKRKTVRSFFGLETILRMEDKKAGGKEEAFEKEQVKARIKEAVNKLPKQQKEVFILRVYEDMKFKQIAKLMGLSDGGVKSNYFNAVLRIKKLVEEYL